MKILVLQLKRIGDLILTTPALAALRENLPDAHITLVVEDATRELLSGIGSVDEALVFERAGHNGAVWRKLIFSHYDVCLDFTGNDRSVFFSVLSKASCRAAFESVQKSRARALFYNRFIESSVRENHTVDHYLHLLRAVGIESAAAPVQLQLPEWAEKKAGQLLGEAGVQGNFAMIHPGSARPEKYWKPERWAAVIDSLKSNHSLPCIITGSKDPFEKEHIAAITRISPCADLSGRLDLLTLAALAKQTRLLLSVDSAAMHLAAAFETPQVALFGPTNPFHWRPRHPRAVIIQAGTSVEPSVFKPHHQSAPMSEISTERVTGAISAALRHVQKE